MSYILGAQEVCILQTFNMNEKNANQGSVVAPFKNTPSFGVSYTYLIFQDYQEIHSLSSVMFFLLFFFCCFEKTQKLLRVKSELGVQTDRSQRYDSLPNKPV